MDEEKLEHVLRFYTPQQRESVKALVRGTPRAAEEIFAAIAYEQRLKERDAPELKRPRRYYRDYVSRPSYFRHLTNFFPREFEEHIAQPMLGQLRRMGKREREFTFRERIMRYVVFLRFGDQDRAWDLFGGYQSSTSRDIHDMGDVMLLCLYNLHVYSPPPDSREYEGMRESYCFRYWKNLVMSVDVTPIRIYRSGDKGVQRRHWEMKHNMPALNMLGFVDSLGFFRYIYGPKPGGSYNDAGLWNECQFVRDWSTYVRREDKIVGDGAYKKVIPHKGDLIYPCLKHMTDVQKETLKANPDLKRKLRHRDLIVSRSRIVVEHAFARLKIKFKVCQLYTLELTKAPVHVRNAVALCNLWGRVYEPVHNPLSLRSVLYRYFPDWRDIGHEQLIEGMHIDDALHEGRHIFPQMDSQLMSQEEPEVELFEGMDVDHEEQPDIRRSPSVFDVLLFGTDVASFVSDHD